MHCLTSAESSEWLRQRGIPEAPYAADHLPLGVEYLQFAPASQGDPSFVSALFAALGPFHGGLLNFVDWIWDSDYEAEPTKAIRLSHGEHRPLIDAPGHVLDDGDASVAMDLSRLAITRGWTAYLYLASKSATVLFWEGALIDFWGYDQAVTKAVQAMVTQSQLRLTDAG